MNVLKIKYLPSVIRTLSLLFLSVGIMGTAYAQDGANLFKVNCTVCHTIGKGRLIGPDLANVHMRRDKQWIYDFVRGSSTMINNGDETAVALFEEFYSIIMPDQEFFSDQELDAILAYIESESPEYVAESEPSSGTEDQVKEEPVVIGKSVGEASEEEIDLGRLLFSGNMRLESEGPSCLTCHHVQDDRLIGGGLLAKDLTQAFSRLNENGIKGMLINPPFPAMRKAYENHPISSDEAYLITAYLKVADSEHYYQHERDYQARFFFTGLGGLAILLILFSLIWRRRKSNAVNKKIFERQIQSESY